MEWLNISTFVELVRVQTDDIVFVQADGNYSDMYLFNGKFHKMTFKLKFFEDAFLSLRNNFFVRVGKSLIVNKKYVYVINLSAQELIMSGARLTVDFKLQASKDALKDLKAIMESETAKEPKKNVTATGADREKPKDKDSNK